MVVIGLLRLGVPYHDIDVEPGYIKALITLLLTMASTSRTSTSTNTSTIQSTPAEQAAGVAGIGALLGVNLIEVCSLL